MVVLCLWRVADIWRLSVRKPVLIQFCLLITDSRVAEYVCLLDRPAHESIHVFSTFA